MSDVEERKVPKFVDESDREFYTQQDQRFVSKNQDGPITGHYVEVDGEVVRANASHTNRKNLFKTHTVLTERDAQSVSHEIVILENMGEDGRIISIDRANERVRAKVMRTQDGRRTSPSKYNTLEEVKKHHSDALFYKIHQGQGSNYFYFKSILEDKQRILGFDPSGNAMDPTTVQPGQDESLFFKG